MLAVMLAELARRGDWTWADAIEIQRAVLAYRTAVHDFSRDLEADGIDLLAARRRARADRAARLVVDRPRLRRRRPTATPARSR